MNEYKITYSQMKEIMEAMNNGYECENIQEYQGYMTITLAKNDEEDRLTYDMYTV